MKLSNKSEYSGLYDYDHLDMGHDIAYDTCT